MEKRILQHLFGIFLATLPISTIWLLWGESAFASGSFSVWSSFFISLPSAVLFMILGCSVFWVMKGKISSLQISSPRLLFALVLLLCILLLATLWVENPWLHILSLLYVLLAVFTFSFFEDTRENWLVVGRYFIGSMAIVSIIAGFQFLFQHSVGFSFLGEPAIAPDILGVAKIDIGTSKYIRSYGTFLHPNILAFFSIMAFYIANRIGLRYLKWFFILPLLLSFSRAGFLAFIISYFFTFRSFQKKELLTGLGVMGLGIGITLPFIVQRLHIFDTAFFERLEGIKTSLLMFFHQPWGVGLKHFTLWMQDYSSNTLFPWEFQPVHNVFLLMLNEIGIFAFGIVLWILWQVWKRTVTWQRQILLVLLVVALFDHYLWTSISAQLFALFFLTLCCNKRI